MYYHLSACILHKAVIYFTYNINIPVKGIIVCIAVTKSQADFFFNLYVLAEE